MQKENIKKWWEKVKLGDIVEFCSRWISPKYSEKWIFIINQKCIRDNKIDYSLCRYHDIDKKFSSDKLIKIFDILINSTWVWTLWRISQVKKNINNFTVDSHVTILRLNWTIYKEFIWYVLINKEVIIESLWKWATGQTELSREDLKNIQITIPESLQTQQKIASILSKYDDLIENNNKRIKILEDMAQTIYKEWFIDFRFPWFENVKMIDSGTEFWEIPEGWEVKKVWESFTTVLWWTPSRANKVFWWWNIPWINSWKVNDLIIINESEFITELWYSKSSTKLMPKWTTVIAITWATLWQVSILWIEACANQSVIWIYDETWFYSNYIYYFFINNINRIISHAWWWAQQHINKDIVNQTKLIIPRNEIIDNFNKSIWEVIDEMKNLFFQNQNLKQTRDILIPKLVSWEVDVEDLDVKI